MTDPSFFTPNIITVLLTVGAAVGGAVGGYVAAPKKKVTCNLHLAMDGKLKEIEGCLDNGEKKFEAIMKELKTHGEGLATLLERTKGL